METTTPGTGADQALLQPEAASAAAVETPGAAAPDATEFQPTDEPTTHVDAVEGTEHEEAAAEATDNGHPWIRRTLIAAGVIAGGAALIGAGFLLGDDGDGSGGGEKVAGAKLIAEETCTRTTHEDIFYADWATGNRVATPIQGETLEEKVNYYLSTSLANDRLQLVLAGVEAGTIVDVHNDAQIDARVAEFGTNESARNQAYHDVCERLRSGTVREDTITGSYWTHMALKGAGANGQPLARQVRSSKVDAKVTVWEIEVNGETKILTLLDECQQWTDLDEFTGIPHLPPETPATPNTTPGTPPTTGGTTPTTGPNTPHTTPTTFPPKPGHPYTPGDGTPADEDNSSGDSAGAGQGPSGQQTDSEGRVPGETRPTNPPRSSTTTTTTQPQSPATTTPQPTSTQPPQPANPSTPTTSPNTTPPPPESSI